LLDHGLIGDAKLSTAKKWVNKIRSSAMEKKTDLEPRIYDDRMSISHFHALMLLLAFSCKMSFPPSLLPVCKMSR
jgi:hypothetical protein